MRFAPTRQVLRGVLALATLTTIVVVAIPAGETSAQDVGPTMRVSVPVTEIDQSEDELNVTIIVENVTNLGGFGFDLLYDDDVLAAVSVQKTTFLGSSGREVVCDDPDLAPGIVRFTCVTLRPEPAGVAGSGDIAVVTFDPQSAGKSTLELSGVKLAEIDGTQIPNVADIAAEVTVTGENNTLMIASIVGGAVVVLVVACAALLFLRRRGTK